MVALARAFAALGGRSYVTAHDVVRAAAPTLAHRVAGSSASVAAGRELAEDCIAQVPAPTV
jgi:Mg-chelatase subunit ChlI